MDALDSSPLLGEADEPAASTAARSRWSFGRPARLTRIQSAPDSHDRRVQYPDVHQFEHDKSPLAQIRMPVQSHGSQDSPQPLSKPKDANDVTATNNKVAVLGMACRFPAGCDSPEAFWDFISKGGNGMTPTPVQRWNVQKFTNTCAKTPSEKVQYVMSKGAYVHGVELFDGGVFGINPAEARHMDPQQRLLMEVVHSAIHDAGYTAAQMENTRTCVFVGVMNQDTRSLQEHDGYTVVEATSSYKTSGAAVSMCAGRISHHYGLLGAASTLDTACSSSLVALHHGVRAIQNDEADMAIVAGVNLILSPFTTASAAQMGLLSPDVACKTFDETANGYARGEGCGVVVLKRLSDAERDRDRILGIVRATAVMHDGRSTSLVAPNCVAQERLLRYTLQQAKLKGGDVAYMEVHGTGTKLGDAMEMTAVGAVMGEGRTQPLVLGAVKPNIGHLESAAGIAGLIKALMVLNKGEVPRNIHLKNLSSNVREALGGLPVIMPEVTTKVEPAWGNTMIAGVSSFGFSGTIAHVILEQATKEAATRPQKIKRSDVNFNYKSITWSALKDDHELIPFSRKLSDGSTRYWVDINCRLARMLEGHQVFGRVVVPGSALIEMAGAAACAMLESQAAELGNVTITAPMVMSWLENDDMEPQLPTMACTVNPAKGTFEISSHRKGEEGGQATVHVKGTYKRAEPDKGSMDIAAVQARCKLSMTPQKFNEDFDKVGLTYTGQFDVVREVVYSTDGEALCKMQPMRQVTDVLLFYNPPALLDATFRVIRAAMAGQGSQSLGQGGKALLPFSFGKIVFMANGKMDDRVNAFCGITHTWGHCKLTASTATSVTASCTLMDSKGKSMVRIEGFMSRELPLERFQGKMKQLPGALYATLWQPVPALPQCDPHEVLQKALVLSLTASEPCQGLLAVLAGCGCSVHAHGGNGVDLLDAAAVQQLVDAEMPQNIVLLAVLGGSEDQATMEPLQASHVVLLLLKAVQKVALPMVVTTVISGAWRIADESLTWQSVAASGTVGLIRSGRHEIHGCSLRLLDLESKELLQAEHAAQLIAAEVAQVQDVNVAFDGEIAYRGGQRYVPRMSRKEVITTDEVGRGLKFRADPNGIYVITGGFGGVGICVAQQLADSGAGCVALISRSGKLPHADQEGLLRRYKKLRQSFVEVRTFACDVRDVNSLGSVLAQLRQTGKPIRGVLHAAGELADATIPQQSWETMEKAFAVRAHGAINLDRLTANDQLEFFVMITSVSGLIGNHGQANYAAANTFMDTLAQWRVSRGLPGLAIQLTGVSELGIAAANLTEAKLKRFHPVPPQVVALGVSTGVVRHASSVVLGLLTDNPDNLRDLFKRMRLNEPRISSMWEGVQAPAPAAATPAASPRLDHAALAPAPTTPAALSRAGSAVVGVQQMGSRASSGELANLSLRRIPTGQRSGRHQPSRRVAMLEEKLLVILNGVLGVTETDDLRTAQLTDLGMDSLGATEIANALNDDLQLALPVSFVFENPSVAQLATALHEMLPKEEEQELLPESPPQPKSAIGAAPNRSSSHTQHHHQQTLQAVDELVEVQSLSVMVAQPPAASTKAIEPTAANAGTRSNRVAQLEQTLTACVVSVLGVSDGPELREGQLTDLGMDSLGATEIANAINDELGLQLPVSFVFENPSIAQLSVALDAMLPKVEIEDVTDAPQPGQPELQPPVYAVPAEQTAYAKTLPLAKLTSLTTPTTTTRAVPTDVPSAAAPPAPPAMPKVCFMFTGQSSQYKGMCQELYDRNTTFRSLMLECEEIVSSILGWSVLELLYGEAVPAEVINTTGYAQPAIFCVQMALARTWLAAGVKPDVVCGHSLGEYAAACIGGALTLREALLLVCTRGALMQKLDSSDGTMLAVPVSYEMAMEAISAMPPAVRTKIGVAAVNAPKRVVLSGSKSAVDAVAEQLAVKGTTLRTSHAFHTPLMSPMLPSFKAVLAKVHMQPLSLPMVSTVLADVITETPVQYWLDQIVRPVKFHGAMTKLHALGCNIFVEIGPRINLIKLGQQSLSGLPGAAQLVWQPSVDPDKPGMETLTSSINSVQQQLGLLLGADESTLPKNTSLIRSIESMLPDLRLPSFPRATGNALAPKPTPGGPPKQPEPAQDLPGLTPSHQQLQMLLLSQLYPTTAAYNLPFVFRPKGMEVSDATLDAALMELCNRHTVLRSVFLPEESFGLPRIIIKDYAESGIHVHHVDAAAVPPPSADAQQAAAAVRFKYDMDREYDALPEPVLVYLKTESLRPFDVVAGPLVRCVHVRLAANDHVILFNMHHSVSDGWSMGVACREMATAMGAQLLGSLAPHAQYMEVLAEEQAAAKSGALEAGLKFWKERLADAPALLDLPLDRPRPARPRLAGRYVDIDLGAKRTAELRVFAAQQKITPYMVLLATYCTTLARYAGTERLVVGSPYHGRKRKDMQGSIGCFMNVLPLAMNVPRDSTFAALLTSVRNELLHAFKHAEVPFPQIVQELGLAGSHAINPLFQTMFVMQDQGAQQDVAGQVASAGINVSSCELHLGTSHFDLTLELLQRGHSIMGMLEYDSDILDEASVKRMRDHMIQLLDSAMAGPQTTVAALQLMGQQHELYDTVHVFNSTFAVGPANMCLHQLFQQQAAQIPDAPALLSSSGNMTYTQLLEASEKIAAGLKALGITREERVGVLLPRSCDLVSAILGVLSAGGAYVPVDPSYPQQRITHIFEDAGCRFVITIPEHIDSVGPDSKLLFVKELTAGAGGGLERHAPAAAGSGTWMPPAPTSLAYVIYTSGSTGKPKGVMIEHASIVNHVYHWIKAVGAKPGDVIPAVSAIGFDASVKQMFVALCSGAALKLVGPMELLEGRLGADVSLIVDITPSALTLLSPKGLPRLRSVSLGGEHVPLQLVHEWAPHVRVLNEYGPTEAAVACMIAELPADAKRILIGRPLPNYQIYMLDDNLKPVPKGGRGELCIAGAGVARGYLNREDLTAQRFLSNPFGIGRMYRSGDLARMHPSGEIELLGRLDRQVKLRGYRIELGEVEAAMAKVRGVKQAVAKLVTLPSGQDQLLAWVTPRTLQPEAVRQMLAFTLPDFMVPSEVLVLDRLPVTANGKTDMDALQLPVHATAAASKEMAMPAGEAAEMFGKLQELWAEVLQVDPAVITASTNFFQVGGNSLLAIKVMSRVRQMTGTSVPIEVIFNEPTLGQMAVVLSSKARDAAPGEGEHNAMMAVMPRHFPNLTAMQAADHAWPLSVQQEQLLFLHQLNPASVAYNVPLLVRCLGPLNIEDLRTALYQLVMRHNTLHSRFCYIGGKPAQITLQPSPHDIPFRFEDLTLNPPVGISAHERSLQLLDEAFSQPFNLAEGKVVRALVVRTEPQIHLVMVCAHHIVMDGPSSKVMFQELASLYNATRIGPMDTAAPLKPLSAQYSDYSSWQRDWLLSGATDAQVAFWRGELEGLPAVLNLPTDYSRPARPSGKGAGLPFSLDAATTCALEQLSSSCCCSLQAVMLAALAVVFARYSNESDFAIALPYAGRSHPDLEPLIGYFVNSLPVRMHVSRTSDFASLVAAVQKTLIRAIGNADVPFTKVVQALHLAAAAQKMNPVYQTMLVLQQEGELGGELALAGGGRLAPVNLSEFGKFTKSAKLDLTLYLSQNKTGLQGWMEYSTDLFKESTVRRMLDALRLVLDAVSDPELAHQPSPQIQDLPMLNASEQHAILGEFNSNSAYFPSHLPLHGLFEEQARKTPEAVAVLQDGRSPLTYAQLNERSRTLAAHVTSLGVPAGSKIAIFLPRSVDFYTAVLAVLKAGFAYVPIDSCYPRDRVFHILQDSGCPLVFTSSKEAAALPPVAGTRAIHLNTLNLVPVPDSPASPQPSCSPNSLAYVIYTSGSTGQPKGVMIEHHSIVNHIYHWARIIGCGAGDVVPAVSAVGFDASVKQMFVPLCSGATLKVVSAISLLDGQLGSEVTHIVDITPSALTLLSPKAFPRLRCVSLGGEQVPLKLVQGWAPHVRVLNEYGPTEAAVACMIAELTADMPRVLVGRPLPNYQIYVLDDRLKPVPRGACGELCIGGEGVARGYLNRDDLSAQRFVANPFARGRMYRSGDLARMHADGEIELLGRLDRQIKLRGYRIEPGEIEAVLAACPNVTSTFVTLKGSDPSHHWLVAYVTPETLDVASLVKQAEASLPKFMVPAAIMPLRRLPLDPHGKLDISALPEPAYMAAGAAASTGRAAAAMPEVYSVTAMADLRGDRDQRVGSMSRPRNEIAVAALKVIDEELPLKEVVGVHPLQQPGLGLPASFSPQELQELPLHPVAVASMRNTVQTLWLEVLQFEPTRELQDTDNFFELGGHSLLAGQLASLLRDATDAPVSIVALFEHSTLLAQTRYLTALVTGAEVEAKGMDTGLKMQDSDIPAPVQLPMMPRKMDIGRPSGDTNERLLPTHMQKDGGYGMLPGSVAEPLPSIIVNLFQLLIILISKVLPAVAMGLPFIAAMYVVPLKGAPWVVASLVHTMLGAVGYALILPLILLCFKWPLLGIQTEGQRPLWRWYYLRWWAVRVMGKGLQATLCPLLLETEMYNMLLRSLGARIGSHVSIDTADIWDHDLINIGNNTVIENGVTLSGTDLQAGTFRGENGTMTARSINIGSEAVVGVRACLGAGSTVSDRGYVPPTTVLGAAHPSMQTHNTSILPGRPRSMRLGWFGELTALVMLLALHGLALWPMLLLLRAFFFPDQGKAIDGQYCKAISLKWIVFAWLQVLLTPASYWLLVLLYKLLVMGRFTEDSHTLLTSSGWWRLRYHVWKRLLDSPLFQLGHLVFGRTKLHNMWLRAVGARVGKGVLLFNVLLREPDLVEIGDDVFVGGACVMACVSPATAQRITVASNSMIGDGVTLLPGVVIEEFAVLGDHTFANVGQRFDAFSHTVGGTCLRPGFSRDDVEGGVGGAGAAARAEQLRKQAEVTAKRTTPGRLLYDFSYLVAALLLTPTPLTVLVLPVVGGYVLGKCVGDLSVGSNVAIIPGTLILGVLLLVLWLSLLKRLLRPSFKGRHAVYSFHTWSWRLLTTVFGTSWWLLYDLYGTHFQIWKLRLLGSTVGRRVCMLSGENVEYDVLEIGAGAVLAEGCQLSGHVVRVVPGEGALLEHLACKVGPLATVGQRATLLAGTHLQERAQLLPNSLAMHGEVLKPGTVWAGVPAVPQR